MAIWLRLNLTRIFSAALCLLLAVAAWNWDPPSLITWIVHIAATAGFLIACLGILARGFQGALFAVAVWLQLSLAMLVVGLLFLLSGGMNLAML